MKKTRMISATSVLLTVLLAVVMCQANGQTLDQEVASLKKDVVTVLYAAGDIIDNPGDPHLQVQHSRLEKAQADMERSVNIVQTILENMKDVAEIIKIRKDVKAITAMTAKAVKLSGPINAMTPLKTRKEIGFKFMKIAGVINSTLGRLEKVASSL